MTRGYGMTQDSLVVIVAALLSPPLFVFNWSLLPLRARLETRAHKKTTCPCAETTDAQH
jgi:hypothetical protein